MPSRPRRRAAFWIGPKFQRGMSYSLLGQAAMAKKQFLMVQQSNPDYPGVAEALELESLVKRLGELKDLAGQDKTTTPARSNDGPQ